MTRVGEGDQDRVPNPPGDQLLVDGRDVDVTRAAEDERRARDPREAVPRSRSGLPAVLRPELTATGRDRNRLAAPGLRQVPMQPRLAGLEPIGWEEQREDLVER